jgi:hypothetical protein
MEISFSWSFGEGEVQIGANKQKNGPMTASSTPWGVRRALIAGLAALTVLAWGLASDAAGAKKKKMRAAGIYVGQTAHIGSGMGGPKTVRFRLTPQGGIVDFVSPVF